MRFRFTPEEEAFREEIRVFLHDELPAGWSESGGASGFGEASGDRFQFLRDFQRTLSHKGWLTLGWPKEHGGMAAGHMMQAIYAEEMAYHRAPTQVGVGPDRVGPTIILAGTEEQQKRFLPGIAGAETVWCQGFSEPGSGSDLASLQTRAVEKIWTSLAHKADWCVLLVRTDPDAPKHKGISYLLVDMTLPGIEVRPLIDITGRHTFNEIFFDNVRVPRDCLVGELNRGWYIAAATLDFERSGINRVVAGIRIYEELVEYCRDRFSSREGIGVKLAELGLEFQIGRLLAYRVASMQARGQVPNAEASISKVFGSELQGRLANTAVAITGLPGQLTAESKVAPLGGRLEEYYLSTSGLTVAAGTSEIQRNIIATRGLELPRG
jgi:alkylation response protein AidB-like acyl-CoA dehydrogenase